MVKSYPPDYAVKMGGMFNLSANDVKTLIQADPVRYRNTIATKNDLSGWGGRKIGDFPDLGSRPRLEYKDYMIFSYDSPKLNVMLVSTYTTEPNLAGSYLVYYNIYARQNADSSYGIKHYNWCWEYQGCSSAEAARALAEARAVSATSERGKRHYRFIIHKEMYVKFNNPDLQKIIRIALTNLRKKSKAKSLRKG